MALKPEDFVVLTDHLAAACADCKASENLLATLERYGEAITDTRDRTLMRRLHTALDSVTERAPAQKMVRNYLYGLVQSLVHTCVDSLQGCNGIQFYCAHYNTGAAGPYRALVSPLFEELYEHCYPGSSVGFTNVHAPAVTFGTQAAGEGYVIGSVLDGEAYAGALHLTGVLEGATYDGLISPSFVAVGVGRTAKGQVESGREWNLRSIGGLGGSTTHFRSVPKHAGDLCLSIHELRLPGNMTGGRITLEGSTER